MTTIFLINKIRVDHQITDTEKVNKINFFNVLVRLHLDYGDILYDQAYNMSFEEKKESLPRIGFTATSVTMLVQRARNVLQNVQKQKSLIPFKINI